MLCLLYIVLNLLLCCWSCFVAVVLLLILLVRCCCCVGGVDLLLILYYCCFVGAAVLLFMCCYFAVVLLCCSWLLLHAAVSVVYMCLHVHKQQVWWVQIVEVYPGVATVSHRVMSCLFSIADQNPSTLDKLSAVSHPAPSRASGHSLIGSNNLSHV